MFDCGVGMPSYLCTISEIQPFHASRNPSLLAGDVGGQEKGLWKGGKGRGRPGSMHQQTTGISILWLVGEGCGNEQGRAALQHRGSSRQQSQGLCTSMI